MCVCVCVCVPCRCRSLQHKSASFFGEDQRESRHLARGSKTRIEGKRQCNHPSVVRPRVSTRAAIHASCRGRLPWRALCTVCCLVQYSSNYNPFMVNNGKVIIVTRDCQVMSLPSCRAISWCSRAPLDQLLRPAELKKSHFEARKEQNWVLSRSENIPMSISVNVSL